MATLKRLAVRGRDRWMGGGGKTGDEAWKEGEEGKEGVEGGCDGKWGKEEKGRG